MMAALFLTMLIRFPWTDLVQNTQNYETIVKIHNFARQNCILLNILSVYDTKQH
jgi:hypothetical protein